MSFTGFNYPYGENLLFTDSHPLYAWVLNGFSQYIYDLSPYSVGIINLTILVGMVLAGWMIFVLLRQYNLPDWYAGVVAFSLFLLAPQWARLQGHLSLSYAFVIPTFWYLLIRLEQSDSKKIWSLVYMLSAVVIGGIHLYYLGIYAVFTMGYGLAKVVMSPDWRANLRSLGYYLALALLPMIFYLVLSSIFDPVDDRPGAPYGFYAYYATLASVFLPEFSAVTRVLSEVISPKINWEGRAFVGTPALLLCLTMVILWIRKWFGHQGVGAYFGNKELNVFLGAAVLALLFSMCIPFRWGLQFITDIVKPLNQFRALGRFSWIFFYVVNVAAAYYLFALYSWGKKQGKGYFAGFITYLLLVLWLFDGYAHFLGSGNISLYPNDKLESHDHEYLARLQSGGYSPDDFQGIMALPVVAIRTDKLVLGGNMTGYNEALKAAFHTGIPVIQSTPSRPSFSQSHSSVQLISDPMIRKTRLDDMDARPLMLLLAKGSELREQEHHLVRQSTVFWEDDYISLHALPLSAFDDQIDEVHATFQTLKDSMDQRTNQYCDPDCDQVVFRDYDRESGRVAFQGTGSLFGKKELILYDSTYHSSPAQASFWVYIDPSFSGMPVYHYQYGPDISQLTNSGPIEFRDGTDLVGNWLRVSFPLENQPYHRITLKGKQMNVDNFAIIPDGTRFYQEKEGALQVFNNFPVTDIMDRDP